MNLELWLYLGLLFWGVGVQSLEAVASVGLAACAAGVIVAAISAGELPAFRHWARRGWPLLAFVAWALVAPTLAGHPPSGSGFARICDWLAIPVAARAFSLLRPERRRSLAYVWGGTLALSALLAGLQHFGVWFAPETFESLGWTRFPFYRVYEPVPGSPGRFMAGGLISHRLKFAHVSGLGVLLALAEGLRSQGKTRVAALGLAGAGYLAVLFFPYARMASVALTFSVLVVLVLAHPRRKWGLTMGAGLVLVATAVIVIDPPLRARFLSSVSATGNGEREKILATGWRAVREHPLTGVGPGRFRPSLYADASTPDEVLQNPGKAHNQLLSIAAEVGIPGLVLFLWVLGFLAREMNPSRAVGVAGLGGLCFLLLLGLAHDPLYQAPFSMGLALFLGVALYRPQEVPEHLH